MKGRLFCIMLIVVFGAELAVLLLYAGKQPGQAQDTVAINHIQKTVEEHWDNMKGYQNNTALDFTVLDADGTVRYRTDEGLSESINSAVTHKDTLLDIKKEGKTVGKLIVYNRDGTVFREERQRVFFIVFGAMLAQIALCAGYFYYMHRRIVKPFGRLRQFARRVAAGDLDIPLEMDRENVFGAFTEGFDMMRSELKKARIAEAKANESKKELVAKLSHDIKTPVASIRAAAEVGAALSADEKNRENYQKITRKTDQINTLVNNLFSATLEELKELTVSPEEMRSTELTTLLENADYLHKCTVPEIPQCLLMGDKLRLQQVFDNIFANSYKYAGTGIRVEAKIEKRFLAVSVEDLGGGVDSAELPLLKEKFRRGSNAANIEGAGLGLFISDYCMKQMKGQLAVQNGKTGLKVTVKIPLSGEI